MIGKVRELTSLKFQNWSCAFTKFKTAGTIRPYILEDAHQGTVWSLAGDQGPAGVAGRGNGSCCWERRELKALSQMFSF